MDEADAYKNLFYTTKMSRIAGLPNSDSHRAFDMFMKTRYIRELTGGRGVVFATGTPISNTMAEMYTMLRYLGPELLGERGVAHFDAWAANFAEAVTALELAPDGAGYRMHTRFAKFINLPELLSMFRSVSDVQTADMLDLPRPAVATGKPQVVAAPASEALKAYIKTLIKRAERLRSSRVDPSVDNILKIAGDGRKAALDMRLVDPFADPYGDTKLSRAAERIRALWEATRNELSTQLVFCDLSTPDPRRFNVYDHMRSQLTAAGVPENAIAFIHDADSDQAKMNLFNAVNAGRVRILIGSTEKMGAGMNVQRLAVLGTMRSKLDETLPRKAVYGNGWNWNVKKGIPAKRSLRSRTEILVDLIAAAATKETYRSVSTKGASSAAGTHRLDTAGASCAPKLELRG